MLDDRNVQAVSTPFNILKNRGNVVWMLNESLDQFNFDSTLFQQAFNIFYAFNNVQDDLFKRPQHLVQQSVERKLQLKQLLKPFEPALRACEWVTHFRSLALDNVMVQASN